MGDLSENFDRKEFECKCGCGFDVVDYELIIVLEDVRAEFRARYPHEDVWIKVNSANRCPPYNKHVDGTVGSQHTRFKAADIVVVGVPDQGEVADYLEEKYPSKYGIGRYSNRNHIDVRWNRARWDSR